MAAMLEASDEAADAGAMERLNEIWELLRRSEKLGYSLTLTPAQAAELARLLEDCKVIKK